MTKYRRLKDSDVWHWCTNCTNWPTEPNTYVEDERDTRPTTGELDNECLAKERRGECVTS